jgi:aspartate/methionine/tyrosine aminotransferase
MLADRIQRIGFSPTLRITAKAKAMAAEGIDVVDLSVGEPDFPTPENIREAGKRAIDANFTKYTANEGIPQLREAIARKLREDHGLVYDPSEIIVSAGAKNCLYNLCIALLNDGDEVIIPAPYWVSYPEMVKLGHGEPIIIPTLEENDFQLTPEELEAALSPRSKALIINNPCNPTGSAYTKEELEPVIQMAVEEGMVIIADEIYEKLVYDGFRFTSIPSLSQKAKEQTVLINGVSKSYSMTGWRIGFAAGPKELIAGMNKVQSHNTSNAASISQMAALEALTGPQSDLSYMRAEFEKRRNFMIHKLKTIPGISCYEPRGAFYVFPNMSFYYNKEYQGTIIRNSYGLAYYLLKQAQVAVVPGDAFGADRFIRFSYATSMERLEEGMNRVVEAMAKLTTPRKVKKVALQNTMTKQRKPVELSADLSVEMRDAMVAEAEAFLTYDNYFEWNANISGVIIQLRTNSPHLHDFWIENFYPAQLEADLEPHGIIYAVNWIPGREAHAFYNSESRTAFYFKTAFYEQLRSIALGMYMDISERLFDQHCIRGFTLEYDGDGVLFLGAPGTGKSEHFFGLLKRDNVRLHANDFITVRYAVRDAMADVVERKFLFPTNAVDDYGALAALFDRSKCENVITNKEECLNEPCMREENCRLDRGVPFCYTAFKGSRAMLDPYWIGGPDKHVKRTNLRRVLLFTKDPMAPSVKKMEMEDALSMVEQGAGASLSEGYRNTPFYNGHFLVKTADRVELQKRNFRKLFKVAEIYLVNPSRESFDAVQTKLCHLLAGSEREALG